MTARMRIVEGYNMRLGSAGVPARSLRRLAEGISVRKVVHRKVNWDHFGASRRDANWSDRDGMLSAER